MARAQALDWNAWRNGEVRAKEPPKMNKTLLTCMVLAGGAVVLLDAATGIAAGQVVATMAAPDFASSLHTAAAPIHQLIKGFAHEIYAIFMGWGAIEAMIGKPQQGFTRMKTATLGYVLLYWVPTIIDIVNKAVPKG